MKRLKYLIGTLIALCSLIALLVGSIELTAFGSLSFYEDMYTELEVYNDVGMNLPDLMDVTREMLDYLRGDREDLTVITTMFGTEREFFNDREKAHMVDVKNLNLGAVKVAWICCGAALLLLTLLIFLHRHFHQTGKQLIRCLAQTFFAGILAFLIIIGVGALIVSTDFDKYWRIFHTIFFTNDLWLLNPNTDMLINIVPEEFFQAFVTQCAIYFAGSIFVLMVIAAIICFITRTPNNNRNTALPALVLLIAITAYSIFPVPVYADGETVSAPYAAAEKLLDSIPQEEPWPAAPIISAPHAILLELNTDTIIYQKEALASAYPASTTKILTALLAIRHANTKGLQDIITYSSKAIYSLTPGSSHIGLVVGEELSVYDSLCGLLLPSANEAANGLAEYVSGSIPDFVALMNTTAAELGAVNTHFVNANGLHDDAHTTCAYDLAQIFKECLREPVFLEISSKTNYVIDTTNLTDEKRPMRTTHRMLLKDNDYYNPYVICGKTGTTDEAGGCLITYAKKDDLSLLCVVMGATSPAQYEDTQKLLDYGFDHFSLVNISVSDSRFEDKVSSTDLLSAGKQLQFYEFDSHAAILLPNQVSLSYLTTRLVENLDGSYSKIQYYFQDYLLAEAEILDATLSFHDFLSYLTDGSDFDNGKLPYTNLKPMQPPESNYTWYIILGCIAGILLIVILHCIYHSKANIQKRRRKNTQVLQNLWRDHL